jgi:hypothetical protein
MKAPRAVTTNTALDETLLASMNPPYDEWVL